MKLKKILADESENDNTLFASTEHIITYLMCINLDLNSDINCIFLFVYLLNI